MASSNSALTRKVSFSTSAREGAVLLLPEGASREDLVDTEKLYPYLKRHASDWYQFLNHYSDIPPLQPIVNGSLFVVTGSDKTKVWASAMFPQIVESAGKRTEFTYDDSQEKRKVWINNLDYNFEGDHSSTGRPIRGPCSLFLRGIIVALGDASWTRAITPLREDSIPLFTLTTRPIAGNLSILDMLRDRYKDYPVVNRRVIFHPAIIVLQMMLAAIPSTEVALFEDSVWSNLVAGRTPSLECVVEVCRLLLEKYDIIQTEDVVHLRRKDSPSPGAPTGGLIQRQIDGLKDMAARWMRRRRALAKLEEVLPRPSWSFVHSHANFQIEYLLRQLDADDE
ncbi:hypothetical protein NLJ89_g2230 [Agrocybe chaxingu]|uniref:Uncharacterized protein n=1 Tax=Agrocybe chaxingu TaxID=84603 RepID=A0A9W8K765_9AGAR|nr:hypothetical protein NLJ89_g2230 [Agrocybe chaxingu]